MNSTTASPVFKPSAPMSAAVGRRARAAFLRENERAYRQANRTKLVEVNARLRAARLERSNALADAQSRCRSERLAARERVKLRRLHALEELRQAIDAERAAARGACSIAKEEAHRATSSAVQRARAEVDAERKYQEDLKRIERGNRQRHRETKRATAAVRRSESDDEVRANLPPEFLALFEKVKRAIKASPRESRTETFLRYAEEHPRELIEALDHKTEQTIRDLERQQREAERRARRKRFTAAELAEVPF